MNNNAIQISPILGTDSLSSSRIVINDNFKILANILENYQEYFNEDGVYSSTMISKNEEGTIDFKTDENHTIMELSSTGIEINGKLVVNGEDPSEFEYIKTDQIDPLTEGTPENPAKILLNGNVEIQGNLSVTGDVPGGGGEGETILIQSINDFINTSASGYTTCYNKGCYISPVGNKTILNMTDLQGLLREDYKKLIQFVNKPFIFCGKGVKVFLNDVGARNKILTNGKLIPGPGGSYLVDTTINDYAESEALISIIRIYPVVSNILESPAKMLNIEFETMIR